MIGVLLTSLSIVFSAVSGQVNLTSTPAADRYPSWSPDGKQIAFETNRNGNWDIYVMKSDGSDQKALTSGKADDRYPRWSPDGASVMFVRAEDGRSDLFAVDPEGRAVKRLAEIEGDELFPDWHPSGKKVAYTSGKLPDTDLFELDLATGRVIRKWSTTFRDLWPRYSRDADVVFFSRRDSNDEEDEIYVANSRLGNMARLTRLPGNDFCPAWSPDGNRIAFARVDPESGRSISVLERRSGKISEFGRGFERVTEPDWSPDGKKIAYTAQKDGIWDVWVETVEPKE
ncbi:MAG: PD40 domain-containing protein [Acidobacteriota bacterium]|nr:MAG: PD40 domain-containing protein [Acidobacteriota bacterium]